MDFFMLKNYAQFFFCHRTKNLNHLPCAKHVLPLQILMPSTLRVWGSEIWYIQRLIEVVNSDQFQLFKFYFQLALDYQLKGITKLSRALSQGFYSIQVHQGQIEHLIKQKSIKVFLANYQNPLDQQILSFALSTFQEYPQFIPKVSPANSYHSTNKEVENVSHVIFMNTKDAGKST